MIYHNANIHSHSYIKAAVTAYVIIVIVVVIRDFLIQRTRTVRHFATLNGRTLNGQTDGSVNKHLVRPSIRSASTDVQPTKFADLLNGRTFKAMKVDEQHMNK